MSREIIEKIREAEAQAQSIRSDAQEVAKARIRTAEAEAKKLCQKAEEKAQIQNREKLDIAKSRAEEVLQSVENDALQEARAMRETADFNMREAVRAIIAGVKEQCQ